jgi:cytochrome c biogenesis protein CcdA
MNLGVDLKRKDVPSVYALGVFGGVASSCCAPVLAGVLVLTVLSGTWLSALTVGLAYVVGMVFPLLVVAFAWDRRAAATPRFFRGRLVRLHLFGHETEIHSSKLVAGGLFIAMGVFTIVLGVLDRMLLTPGSDLFGIYQTALEAALVTAFSNPDVAPLIGGLAGLLIILGWLRGRRARRNRRETDSSFSLGNPSAAGSTGLADAAEEIRSTTDPAVVAAPHDHRNPEA